MITVLYVKSGEFCGTRSVYNVEELSSHFASPVFEGLKHLFTKDRSPFLGIYPPDDLTGVEHFGEVEFVYNPYDNTYRLSAYDAEDDYYFRRIYKIPVEDIPDLSLLKWDSLIG